MKQNCEIPREIIQNLEEMKSLTTQALEMMGVSPLNKNIFYKRTKDGQSILGIKLVDGDDKDDDNYMINVSKVSVFDDDIVCNVFLHASMKCAQETMILSRFITENIVNFFNTTEKILHNVSKDDMDIKITIGLGNSNLYSNNDYEDIEKNKELKENKCKRLVRKIFKSKK